MNCFFDEIFFAATKMRILEIHITEKSETNIPIASMSPNHLIKLIPNIYKIIATIRPVTFESHIAVHDFLNHILAALLIFSQAVSSSLILSKIKILASIAIPIDKIKPATEARVRVTHRNFMTDNIIATYISSATEAKNPEVL